MKKQMVLAAVCILNPFLIFSAKTISVPDDYKTLEAATDAADVDDVILVAPGTYPLSEYTLNKRITLASWFFNTGDKSHIEQTVITGNDEDGIQLIDYPGKSDRIFYIHNNLIAGKRYGWSLNRMTAPIEVDASFRMQSGRGQWIAPLPPPTPPDIPFSVSGG